jgi:hypothetical protein
MAQQNQTAQWLPLMKAVYRAELAPPSLYRAAVMGKVRTRIGARGRVEFAAEDCETLRRQREQNAGLVSA